MIGVASGLVGAHATWYHHGESGGPQLSSAPRFIVVDRSLFTRQDAVEAAWRVVDPILGGDTPINDYQPGSWGPVRASRLPVDRARWRAPQPDQRRHRS